MKWKRFLFVKSQKTWLISLLNKMFTISFKDIESEVWAPSMKSGWNPMPKKTICNFLTEGVRVEAESGGPHESQNKTDRAISLPEGWHCRLKSATVFVSEEEICDQYKTQCGCPWCWLWISRLSQTKSQNKTDPCSVQYLCRHCRLIPANVSVSENEFVSSTKPNVATRHLPWYCESWIQLECTLTCLAWQTQNAR